MVTERHEDESADESDETPADPPAELLSVATASVPEWLRRVVMTAAARSGIDVTEHGPVIETAVMVSSDTCVQELSELLATDVDAQRTNPLSLIRRSVEGPSRVLLDLGATPRHTDAFHRDRFPDDPFGLGPSNWNEVDDELHVAGITWGAWKAMTVLRRRRDEGLLDR